MRTKNSLRIIIFIWSRNFKAEPQNFGLFRMVICFLQKTTKDKMGAMPAVEQVNNMVPLESQNLHVEVRNFEYIGKKCGCTQNQEHEN